MLNKALPDPSSGARRSPWLRAEIPDHAHAHTAGAGEGGGGGEELAAPSSSLFILDLGGIHVSGAVPQEASRPAHPRV